MAEPVEELMIKAGMPTVKEAGRRLGKELESARQRGVRILRVIHGYGSSGKGGKLRVALRRLLAMEQAAGRIGRVVPGERWEIFDAESLTLLEAYPCLREDPDLGEANAGMTLVEVRRARGPRRRSGQGAGG